VLLNKEEMTHLVEVNSIVNPILRNPIAEMILEEETITAIAIITEIDTKNPLIGKIVVIAHEDKTIEVHDFLLKIQRRISQSLINQIRKKRNIIQVV